MTHENSSLLTIITEAALETQLLKDFAQLGAPGYTITNARGKGSRGTRGAAWEANSNIRIEIICDLEVANRITDHLRQRYFENYAMVTFIAAVDVMRPEKFKP